MPATLSAPMEIPVFCYHNAVAPGLARDLAFLQANGYRTLLASELVDVLTGAAEAPEKPVAVTFDDGLESVKTVGLPLLEQHDARATVFAITGLVPDEPPPAGRSDALLTWDELAGLRRSGRFEIGSHGHRHNPVFVGASTGAPVRVADYGRVYDVPVPYSAPYDEAGIRAVDGTPGGEARPLFGAATVVVEGRSVPAAPLVADDLTASRHLLATRLGVERFHLALPYGAGTDDMPALAQESGFESIFWSRRDDRDANRPGDDPFRIVRRKHDFTRRLPGDGRRSAIDVLFSKLKRRMVSDPWE